MSEQCQVALRMNVKVFLLERLSHLISQQMSLHMHVSTTVRIFTLSETWHFLSFFPSRGCNKIRWTLSNDVAAEAMLPRIQSSFWQLYAFFSALSPDFSRSFVATSKANRGSCKRPRRSIRRATKTWRAQLFPIIRPNENLQEALVQLWTEASGQLSIQAQKSIGATEAVISSDKIFVLGATWRTKMDKRLHALLVRDRYACTMWVDTCTMYSCPTLGICWICLHIR